MAAIMRAGWSFRGPMEPAARCWRVSVATLPARPVGTAHTAGRGRGGQVRPARWHCDGAPARARNEGLSPLEHGLLKGREQPLGLLCGTMQRRTYAATGEGKQSVQLRCRCIVDWRSAP